MKPKTKHTLTPKLRFPEFRDMGGWEDKTLGKFITERNQSPEENVPLFSLTIENGITQKTERYERSFLVKNEEGAYKLVLPDDFAYNPMNLRFGAIARHSGVEKVALSKYYNIFYCNESVDSRFCEHYFKSDYMIKFYDNMATGSLIEKRRVHFKDFLKFNIRFPTLPEQQKIAACLTSLDDLITAHSHKLAALRAYKTGLLQQLFPSEGETVPKLRFPEFRGQGGWEVRKLGDVCEKIMDGTHFSPKSNSGPRMYLTSKNIQNGIIDLSNVSYITEEEHRQIYDKCPVKKNDLLLTKDGANTGNCALNNIAVEFSLLSSVAVLRGNPLILEQNFLYQAILSDKIQRLIQESMSGQAITRITLKKIGNFSISMTSLEEQQKIATFLTTLDDQIAAQAAKIDALKEHKKGLLQQLFPTNN